MKFMHAADIHLDSPLLGLQPYDGAPLNQIRGATRRAFENLIQLCLDERVDFLLIAGDLYDGDWTDFHTGLFFVRQMASLNKAGIPVFVVRGNHDAQSKMTRALPLPGNVHEFSSQKAETKLLEILRVALHGRSFPTQAVDQNLVSDYPQPISGWFNIGLLHTALEGDPEHASYAPCSLDQLVNRGYNYWALGHVHRHQILSEDPAVVFPGNLQGRHIREVGPKGCCLVEVEDGRITALTHRPVDVLRWVAVDIPVTGLNSKEELLQGAKVSLQTQWELIETEVLAVRFRFVGASQLHPTLLRNHNQIVNDIRAIGLEVGAGSIFVEDVQIATTAPGQPARVTETSSDALDLVLSTAASLASDADALASLREEFNPLVDKLPSELHDGGEGFTLDSEESLRALLSEAQQVALTALTSRDEEP